MASVSATQIDGDSEEDMTQKIVDVSEIENMHRYDPHIDGLMHQHEFGDYIEYDYLKEVILRRAPSLSGDSTTYAWYRECNEINQNLIEHINNNGETVYIEFRMSTPPPNHGWEPLYTAPQPDRVAELQAKIDKLMLEYCPNEMTKEQLDNWAKHQALVTTKD